MAGYKVVVDYGNIFSCMQKFDDKSQRRGEGVGAFVVILLRVGG